MGATAMLLERGIDFNFQSLLKIKHYEYDRQSIQKTLGCLDPTTDQEIK
jgi:hypothetical protein|tara:strand:+ start:67932 stop:68078 length:147 start_codon:yes stop_codon:yes gene_type:complete